MTEAALHTLADALAFAVEAHGGQTRRGKDVPYVSHLLQVAGLVLEYGGSAEHAAAALLHDCLEDCEGVSVEMLRDRFGAEVARIVSGCSDLLPGDRPDAKSPWPERKQHYLAHLRCADAATRLVAACDKLHNLRDLVEDLRGEGAETLARFNASASQTLWYQGAVREALGERAPTRLLREFDALLAELRERLEADLGPIDPSPLPPPT